MTDESKFRSMRRRDRQSRIRDEEDLIERGIERLLRRQTRRDRRNDYDR